MRKIPRRLLQALLAISLSTIGGNLLASWLIDLLPDLSVFPELVVRVFTASSGAIIVISILLYRHLKNYYNELDVAHAMIDSSNLAVIVTDSRTVIEDVNDYFTVVTGFAREEVIGKKPSLMKSGIHNLSFYADMWAAINKTGQWQGEIWDKKKNGEMHPKWLSIKAIKDWRGHVRKYVGVFTDITSLKECNEQVEYLLENDKLTGLPNRTTFLSILQKAMTKAKSEGDKVAILAVDIESFSHVNEAFGYSNGDQLLKDAAGRIQTASPTGGVISRMGPDEFYLLLPNVRNNSDVVKLAELMVAKMSEPYMVRTQHIHLGVNVGICIYPDDGIKSEELITKVGKALKLAREKGSNFYQFYNEEIKAPVIERLRVETNLRLAIENKEFVLLYQPQVNIITGEVFGAEPLVRRQEADWLVPAGMFIDVAEESGLIVDICEWTLDEACEQQMKWVKEGMRPIRMSVNFTSRQFLQNKAVSKVRETLDRTGIDPKYLEIEITERTIMYDTKKVVRALKELREMGVTLAIDDFGTGYSSLSYLNQFPIETIKIDISFVREMMTNPQSAALVKTIINMAHNLGFRALAEGVETKEQLDFLRENGCEDLQGYYFSWPLDPERFADLMKESRKLI